MRLRRADPEPQSRGPAFAEFDSDNVSILLDGSRVVLETNGLPNHVSPYWSNTNYEHSGFWGTRAVYVPELDLVVAGAVTEQSQGRAVFEMTERAVELVAGVDR